MLLNVKSKSYIEKACYREKNGRLVTPKHRFLCLYIFVPDSKKAGGKYVTKKGYIKKIREFESDVVFDDDTEVLIDDILYVENDLFTDIE